MTTTARVGRPRKEDDVDRRALVLDAAIARFADCGFEAVTLAEIGRCAGVAPALIRHYFKSKDGLILACNAAVGERLGALFAVMDEEAARAPMVQILAALLAAIRGRLEEERRLFGYLCWLFLAGGPDADRLFAAYHDALARLVETLRARGVIGPGLPTYWFVQQVISLQMGPYFLARPIRGQLGRDPFDPAVAGERWGAMLQMLRAAVLASQAEAPASPAGPPPR